MNDSLLELKLRTEVKMSFNPSMPYQRNATRTANSSHSSDSLNSKQNSSQNYSQNQDSSQFSQNKEAGTRIDGYAQVLSLLQEADHAFRKSLLIGITKKDPELAMRLMRELGIRV